MEGTFCVLDDGFVPCACCGPAAGFIGGGLVAVAGADGPVEVGPALSVAESGSEGCVLLVLVLERVGVMGDCCCLSTGEEGL